MRLTSISRTALVALATGLTLTGLFLVAAPRPVTASVQDEAVIEKLLYPKTVVFVRHAEKATDDPRDPSLSEAGQARAEALAQLLEPAGVTHLFASEFKRTQMTLNPLSLLCGKNVQIVSARTGEAQLSALRDLPRDSLAVVAGHSNTVPGFLAAFDLKVPGLEPHPSGARIEDDTYDRLFLVTLWGSKPAQARLVELHFGE